jgi:uncharacterized protein YbjT (DUF2867 family)
MTFEGKFVGMVERLRLPPRMDRTMSEHDAVLLAGASGDTGGEVLTILAETDITVRALTRSREKVERLRRLGADEVVVGNLLNRDDITQAVENVDAVLTAVGTHPSKVLFADEFVDGRGNVNLVDASVDADVETFVMESSLGVDEDRGSIMARAFRVFIRPVIKAKTGAERAIRKSELEYTIFRPGVLVGNWATGDVQVADAGTGLWGIVSCRDVARLMVAALDTPEATDRTFEVVRNPLFRDRELDVEW